MAAILVQQCRGSKTPVSVKLYLEEVPHLGQRIRVITAKGQLRVDGHVESVCHVVTVAEEGHIQEIEITVTLAGWKHGHDYTSSHNKVRP